MKSNRLIVLAAALAFTGCGGSSSGVTPSAPKTPVSVQTPGASTNAQFSIVIPAASTSVQVRKAQYVSAATRSVTIALQNGSKLGTFDVSSGAALCKAAADGGRTCTMAFSAPAGSDTFVVDAYDQPGGGGNLLAAGTVVQQIAQSGNSTVAVDLTGVTASIAIALSVSMVPNGKPASIPIVVQALDASGNTIIGTYDRAIALSDSDTSGHTRLSATSIADSKTAVTLEYDGAQLSAGATISASAPGVASRPVQKLQTTPGIAVQYDLGPIPEPDGSWDAPPGAEGIVQGRDGNLWIAAATAGAILKMTPDGRTTAYWPPTPYSFPQEEVVGKDGAVWFTERDGNNIGRIAMDGTITEYPVPTQSANVLGICVGPDGNIWFAEQTGDAIGRVNGDGTIAEFPLPPSSAPSDLIAGPDGNLWIAENRFQQPSAIAVMSTTGTIVATHPLAKENLQPYGIVTGPDANLWFGEFTGGAIARMTPSGQVTEYAPPSSSPGIVSLAVANDGDIWFAESGSAFAATGQLGYITPGSSTIHEVYLNIPLHVRNITVDANGAIWYSGFSPSIDSDPDSHVGEVIP